VSVAGTRSLLALPPDEPLAGCPVCGGAGAARISDEGVLFNQYAELTRLTSDLCLTCGVIYTNPRHSRGLLARFYAEEQSGRQSGRPLERALSAPESAKTARLVEFVRPFLGGRARYLEIGCGECNVLAAFARRLPEGTLTGLDPSLAGDSRPAPNVALIADRIDEAHTPPALAPPYDCVAAFHVLEHQHDPVAFLRRLGRLLAPTGVLYLEVPNTYRPFRLGKPVEVFFSTVHLCNHGRRSLEHLLRASGFAPVAWDETHRKGLRVVSTPAPDRSPAPAPRPLTPGDVAVIRRYFALWKQYSTWRRTFPLRYAAPLFGALAWRRVARDLARAGL